MRGKICIVLILLLVNLTSVVKASDFFGLKIITNPFVSIDDIDISQMKSVFTITSKKGGDIKYTYYPNKADPTIEVYAYLTEGRFVVDIYNYSKKPIKLNPLIDKYYLVTGDGTFYEVEPSFESYPAATINPGTHRAISMDHEIEISGIKYVIAIIGLPSILLFMHKIR